MYVLRKVMYINDCDVDSFPITDERPADLIGLYEVDGDGYLDWIEDYEIQHLPTLENGIKMVEAGLITIYDLLKSIKGV